MNTNYYDLIGVAPDSSVKEIKHATQKRVAMVKKAYAILSNADERATYDAKQDHRLYRLLAVASDASDAELKAATKAMLDQLKAAYDVLSDVDKRAVYNAKQYPNETVASANIFDAATQPEMTSPSTSSSNLVDKAMQTEIKPLDNDPLQNTSHVDPYAAPQSEVEMSLDDEGYAPFKLFSLTGRVNRIRYFIMSMLMGVVMQIGIVSGIFLQAAMATTGLDILGWVVMGIGVVIGVTASFCLTVQRIHDFNLTGWLFLIFLVPLINIVLSFALLLYPGTQGENNYGLQPYPSTTIEKIIVAIAVLLIIGSIIAAIMVPALMGSMTGGIPME